ncbi:hypothetical protein ACJX0J_028735, partial [Zea mays]
ENKWIGREVGGGGGHIWRDCLFIIIQIMSLPNQASVGAYSHRHSSSKSIDSGGWHASYVIQHAH